MAEQMQGDCSLLCPGYLLAECLRLPKVQICIGTFLRAAPELPAALPEGVVLAPCKPGRPAKGTVRPPKPPTGRFGGQAFRDAEAQIKMLQKNMKEPCVPKKTFVRWARDVLESQRDPKGAMLKMTPAAIDTLQSALEDRVSVAFGAYMNPNAFFVYPKKLLDNHH
jgi:hypothetical protein